MTSRRRAAAPTHRRVGSREPKRLIVVICEGSKTEPQYLRGVERHAQDAVLTLKILDEPATSPKQLVDRACEGKRDAVAARKRTRDPNSDIDQVWCVFDVDQHPKIPEAVVRARDNGVKLAISNPCVELWFLLHFVDQTAFIDRAAALRELKKHFAGYDKRVNDITPFLGRFEAAADRARKLAQRHDRNGTGFPDNNPSSDVFRLVEALGGAY